MSKRQRSPGIRKAHYHQMSDVACVDPIDAYKALMQEREQQLARQLAEAKASGLIPEISTALLQQLQSVSDRYDEKIHRLLCERTRYEHLALVAPARNLTKEKPTTTLQRPLPPTESRQMVIAHIRAIDRSLETIVEKRNHAAKAKPIRMPRIRGGRNFPAETGAAGNTWVSKSAAKTRAAHAERWQEAQRTLGQDNQD